MTRIRERLKGHLPFQLFAQSTSKLYEEAEDPEAVAEALAEEDFKRAQELSGLSESEFVETLEGMNNQADKLAQDEKVRTSIKEIKKEE
ncbi:MULTISPECIES: hypothetical protein [unclassified Natrinema]|uniref:hypothetical protein n=1 Tax=unclassified Natrinema TaxID=2622230 RepID=UPI0011AE7F41|nr:MULTISPECIES: hypothetical protein [unclassified Natrinema]